VKNVCAIAIPYLIQVYNGKWCSTTDLYKNCK